MAKDDPDFDLYAQSWDADAVIRYVRAHSRADDFMMLRTSLNKPHDIV